METRETKGRSSKLVVAFFSMAFVGLALIAAILLIVWTNSANKTTLSDVDKDGYQAVFLDNGQVYFGKLQAADNEYVKLTDVWYLRASETDGKDSGKLQESATNSTDAIIIKLGNEIHGPKDAMLISKSQVLFYENLKEDGKVVKAIKQDAK